MSTDHSTPSKWFPVGTLRFRRVALSPDHSRQGLGKARGPNPREDEGTPGCVVSDLNFYFHLLQPAKDVASTTLIVMRDEEEEQ